MTKGIYYLATPYQGTEEEKKYRTEMSLKMTTEFLRHGIHLFAPIIYVNKIAEELGLPSLEKRREIVMPYLFDFLRVSKGLILISLEGWQNSWGVRQELKFCHDFQIPVYKMESNTPLDTLPKIVSTPLDPKSVSELINTL